MDWSKSKWKPKTGDKVICLKTSQSGGFLKGASYIVESIDIIETLGQVAVMVIVKSDSNGRSGNGFNLKWFRPASKAAQILYTTKE